MLAAGGRAWLCALALLLPVLCTDAAPRPPNYRGPRLFSESAFFSHKKTQLLPVFPPLDLAVPGQLDVALEARAYKRQLILFMFDATAGCKSSCSGKEKSMLGNTVAMIAQLNDIGFAHCASAATPVLAATHRLLLLCVCARPFFFFFAFSRFHAPVEPRRYCGHAHAHGLRGAAQRVAAPSRGAAELRGCARAGACAGGPALPGKGRVDNKVRTFYLS